MLLVLGVLTLPYRACDGSAVTVVTEIGQSASFACGGLHPAVLLAPGVALLVAGLAGAARNRRHI